MPNFSGEQLLQYIQTISRLSKSLVTILADIQRDSPALIAEISTIFSWGNQQWAYQTPHPSSYNYL